MLEMPMDYFFWEGPTPDHFPGQGDEHNSERTRSPAEKIISCFFDGKEKRILFCVINFLALMSESDQVFFPGKRY